MDDYDLLAAAVAAVRESDLDRRELPDGGLPRVEVPLSPEVQTFLGLVAQQCEQDPASVAAFSAAPTRAGLSLPAEAVRELTWDGFRSGRLRGKVAL
jgi:hypothetical protein